MEKRLYVIHTVHQRISGYETLHVDASNTVFGFLVCHFLFIDMKDMNHMFQS